MTKPTHHYTCLYSKGREMASTKIEARSDRGAVRIAAGFQYRDVGYLTPRLKLENILRFNPSTGAFTGSRDLEALVAEGTVSREVSRIAKLKEKLLG